MSGGKGGGKNALAAKPNLLNALPYRPAPMAR